MLDSGTGTEDDQENVTLVNEHEESNELNITLEQEQAIISKLELKYA